MDSISSINAHLSYFHGMPFLKTVGLCIAKVKYFSKEVSNEQKKSLQIPNISLLYVIQIRSVFRICWSCSKMPEATTIHQLTVS